jgi:uncharacterized membrane protein YczE
MKCGIGRVLVFYVLFVLPFQWWSLGKAVAFATIPIAIFGTCFGSMTQLSHMTPDTYSNRNVYTFTT